MFTRKSGLTRIDLLAVLGALCFAALVAVPSFGASRGESKRVACQNNLRQVVAAFHMWMDAHSETVPWIIPVRDGGTRPDAGISLRVGAVWLEMSTLSNYAASPRILACPADQAANPAENWDNGEGGLLNSGYRANAVSYMLGTDVMLDLPRSILAGDRDFRPGSGPGSCSRGFNNVYSVSYQLGVTQWTNLVHSASGNLGYVDGSVESVPSSRLEKTLNDLGISDDAGAAHYLQPR
jgi:prepilin-type processing-associated H-X9-DG protein